MTDLKTSTIINAREVLAQRLQDIFNGSPGGREGETAANWLLAQDAIATSYIEHEGAAE